MNEDGQAARALATRDRILAEAARLFALKGYHDTKLEEIQSAAEVTTGAFFHHFGGKEDLGFAVLDRHMGKRRKSLDEIERRMPPPREDDPLGSANESSGRAVASSATSARRSAIRTTAFAGALRSASTRWPWSSSLTSMPRSRTRL